VTYAYLTDCAIEGAVYVEVMSSPDHAAAAGLSYEAHLEGIVQGIDDAERDHGIIGRLIVTCVRHFGPAQAMKIADQVCGSPHPYVVGFGMGGNELVHTFKDFQPAFNRVHMAGLPCTVHAGEWVGAASVKEALDTLPVQRIGHGVRAIEDRHVLERLAREGVHLEVCPTSNVITKVYPNYEIHPLNELRDAGISVSLNSDDPPYFTTTIGKEYGIANSKMGLTVNDLFEISRNALIAAFIDERPKSELMQRCKFTQNTS
jgi:adenosine deaminase